MSYAPNVEGCTCDRDDDSWVGEPGEMPLCPLHEKRMRHLSWESLACMVIDYEAALNAGEPARTAGDPRVAALEAMAARWEADADAIETSTTSTRNRRRLAAETLRLTASEVRGLLSEASSVREPGGEGAA